ncbi:ABC transporter permease [uncultured Muribaculum sp.]|uniref:ABC transporter permease n=1 Tax=uncultured Muribaculum sp. TaxID=1918613 RepID=UPI0026753E11|nr:ABC transporter permease [uncultured Muribaculum sp.]
MADKSIYRRITAIIRREIGIYSKRPLFLFCLIVAPVLCVVFFVTLMGEGLPTKLPAGIVDEDNTQISRTIYRTIDAMEETDLKYSYPSFSEARSAMQRGEIYAFFYIPEGTTEKAIANRQPRISFYTNEAYLVPGSLLMKDLRTASELSGLAITRENLYAHGLTESQAMGIIQPIVIEAHPLNNPELDYSVYLNNILLPGIFILLITLSTTYTIGLEWKQGSQKQLYAMSGHSSWVAIVGKLMPQTLLFSLMFIFCDIYFYKFLQFPCNSGLFSMIMLGILTVLASQGFGVFLSGIFSSNMRLAMCMCSLWGILSFSLAGFTYPVMAMAPAFKLLSWLFPLRHYYLIYVNQALNGYSLTYIWTSVLALACFAILPLLVLRRYKTAFLKYKYKP